MTSLPCPGLAVLDTLVAEGHMSRDAQSGCCALHLAGDSVADVRLAEGWLLFEVAPRQGDLTAGLADPWSLMGVHAGISGGAKFAAPPEGSALVLRAELPLDDGADPAARVRDVRAGLDTALRWWRSASPELTLPPVRAAVPVDLASLCRDAGWPARECGPDRFAVDLDVRDGFFQALVEPGDQGVRAAVDLLRPGDEAPPVEAECRAALGLFLLRASAMIRLARPVAVDSDAAFEVVLAAPASAAELDHALAALSVASRLWGREAALLARDAELARAYRRFAAASPRPDTSSITSREGGSQ